MLGNRLSVTVTNSIILVVNEQSTHKFISEYLGKETLDTNTYGKSSGKSGSYSTNYQQVGRELLTADEVRLLDNDYAYFSFEENVQSSIRNMIF